MKVYVSGYLSALELDNLEKLSLEQKGTIVTCCSEDAMQRVELLLGCDVIYFVSDWQNSIYSPLELSVAEVKDIEIRYQQAEKKYEILNQ